MGKSLVIKQEPYNPEEIYQLKTLYEFGNQSALDVLIQIYQDKNQLYDIRILCLDVLSEIDNPLVKDALQSTVENVEFIELEYLIKSIEILHNYVIHLETHFSYIYIYYFNIIPIFSYV